MRRKAWWAAMQKGPGWPLPAGGSSEAPKTRESNSEPLVVTDARSGLVGNGHGYCLQRLQVRSQPTPPGIEVIRQREGFWVTGWHQPGTSLDRGTPVLPSIWEVLEFGLFLWKQCQTGVGCAKEFHCCAYVTITNN